ncbi:FtsB family cell division protein [Rarobacter incanus]|uniref:Cell division protein FtsB n=1 Tax=Rarobacter incanus TaxID=153494 RepID=A0A542SNU2_9MICO|nr:septum formation initiator family protein [Rarobacter incanus]TQK76290.1 cell division protein FtsB [Rarobacter incanus]
MSPRVSVDRPRPERLRWVGPTSVRVLIMAIAALGALAVVVPTAMRYVDQQSQTRQLEQQLSQAKSTNSQLQTEIDRWSDQKYVEAQARERLSYGYDGETRYRVIDPQTVVDETNPKTGQAIEPGAVTFPIGKEDSWYGTLWESIEVAGNSNVSAESASAADPSANQ